MTIGGKFEWSLKKGRIRTADPSDLCTFIAKYLLSNNVAVFGTRKHAEKQVFYRQNNLIKMHKSCPRQQREDLSYFIYTRTPQSYQQQSRHTQPGSSVDRRPQRGVRSAE